MDEGHLPVLVEEVIEMLAPSAGSLHIDATLGGGGHTERILEAANPDGRLLGLDADPAAIARVEATAPAALRRPARPAPGELPASSPTVAPEAGFGAVDGCLFDLGLSSFQLADTRARLRLPGRRPARHALRHDAAASRPPSCSRRSTRPS